MKLQSRQSPDASSRSKVARSATRCGRVLTEVLMIVVVPCLCLGVWALCDAELKSTLLAGAHKEQHLSCNTIYDTVAMDDNTLLTASGQGQLKLWNLTDGSLLGEMQSHLNEVRCVAYEPRQRLLAVGSAMGHLEVWDLAQPDKPVADLRQGLPGIYDCLFEPQAGRLVTSGEDGRLMVWEPRTLRQTAVLQSAGSEDPIRRLACSSDGRRILAGTQRGQVQLWDLARRELVRSMTVSPGLVRPECPVEQLAFRTGNREFVAATRNEGIGIWSTETGACIRRLAGDLPGLRSCAVSSDGGRCIAGDELGRVTTWDLPTGQQIAVTTCHHSIIRALGCSADGKTIVSGDWLGRIHCEVTHCEVKLCRANQTHIVEGLPKPGVDESNHDE